MFSKQELAIVKRQSWGIDMTCKICVISLGYKVCSHKLMLNPGASVVFLSL